jgi:hypothetical protein
MVLTDSGAVYGWGTFRDAGGVYGFAPGVRIQLTPRLLYQPASPDARISCIASGGVPSVSPLRLNVSACHPAHVLF